MPQWKRGQQISNTFALAIDGLETIGHLTHQAPVARAVEIVRAVAKAIDVIKGGFDGHMDLEACENALAELRSHLIDNDAQADTRLADKFPAG